MPVRLALRFANHLLAGETWARSRLQPFAGQSARLEFGDFKILLTISRSGLLELADNSVDAAVTISLPTDALLKVLTDLSSHTPSAVGNTRIVGSAELAETLGFVLRNLRWAAEDDISRVVGDVVAHRLMRGVRQLALGQLHRAKNFALNVSEYLTEETPSIARSGDVIRFCSAVNTLEKDLSGLEKRLQRLEVR